MPPLADPGGRVLRDPAAKEQHPHEPHQYLLQQDREPFQTIETGFLSL